MNDANIQKGTSEKNFAINGDCLRFRAWFYISNRNGFYTSPIIGCYFHFTKSFLKKMKDPGLFTHYMDDPLLNGFLRKNFAIAYLPVFYVRQKFYQLTQSTNARLLKNAHTQLISFLHYFEHTWFTTFSRMSTILCAPSYVTHNQHIRGMQQQIECQSGKKCETKFSDF